MQLNKSESHTRSGVAEVEYEERIDSGFQKGKTFIIQCMVKLCLCQNVEVDTYKKLCIQPAQPVQVS